MPSSKLIVLTNHIFLVCLFSFIEYIPEGDPLIISQAAGEYPPPPSSIGRVIYGIMATIHDFYHIVISHVRR